MELGWFAASVALMVVGIVGSVVPFLPGVPLVLAGVYLYALGTSLNAGIGAGHLVAFTLIVLSTMALTTLANVIGVRAAGGSRAAVVGAVVGLIAGLLVGGPVGLLLGPFAGAVLFEVLAGRATRQAIKSGIGAALGLLIGRVTEFSVALGLSAWFLVSVLGSIDLRMG